MSELQKGLNRREVLMGATAAAAAVVAAPSMASADQHGHDHGAAHSAMQSTGQPHQNVVAAAAHCLVTGQACMDHCLELFAAGDTSVAQCARTVQEMLPTCQALMTFASLKAPHLQELAKLCIKVCADCEKECRKHELHHAACKACADSCADCIKACKTLVS